MSRGLGDCDALTVVGGLELRWRDVAVFGNLAVQAPLVEPVTLVSVANSSSSSPFHGPWR